MMRVLIVERDPSLARLYREELEDAGFGVQVQSDLRRALKALKGKPAHVLVTDLEVVGGRLEHWMDHLRQVHKGGVVLLGRQSRRLPAIRGLSVMEKSSDLSRLVNCLQGMAGSAMWSRAAGSC
jgi:DNA-binding response OmpR family regulator